MKKLFSLAAVTFALVLTGCDDVQVSTGASWGVDRISYGNYYGRGWDYRPHMHRRQRQWKEHNDRHWGGRPGWKRPDFGNRGPRHGGPRFGDRHDRPRFGGPRHGGPRRHHGPRHGGPGRHFLADITPVMAEVSAPALTKQDLAVYAQIGKTYGIGPKNSARVLESLNRAAVGDFGGLADLGLNKNALASAKRNNGRLAAAELDRLSRKLGVSQQKLDAMIQDVLKR